MGEDKGDMGEERGRRGEEGRVEGGRRGEWKRISRDEGGVQDGVMGRTGERQNKV